MKRRRIQVYGFTLIELMMVSAIIGLLVAIAIPKFGNLVIKAKEAAVKGKLGAFRSAISIYYADMEGIFPRANPYLFDALTIGAKYLNEIPSISIPTVPRHAYSLRMQVDGPPGFLGIDWNSVMDGRNAWYYNNAGLLLVNCSHTDSMGRPWSTW